MTDLSNSPLGSDDVIEDHQRRHTPRDIYAVTGRAAPQIIPPARRQSEHYDPAFDQRWENAETPPMTDDAATGYAPTSERALAPMDEEQLDSHGAREKTAQETRIDMPTSRQQGSNGRRGYDDHAPVPVSNGYASDEIVGHDDDGHVHDNEPSPGWDNPHEILDTRRGTTDFGLFLSRLALGLMLLFHGLRTLFEWGGSAGVDGLQNDFFFMKGNEILSWAIPIAETASGAFLILGVLAPLAAAVSIAIASLMSMYSIDLQPGAFSPFNASAQVQVWLLLTGMAVGMAFTGPGRWGVDGARGWSRRPVWSGWLSVIVGLLAGAALWVVVAGSNPFN